MRCRTGIGEVVGGFVWHRVCSLGHLQLGTRVADLQQFRRRYVRSIDESVGMELRMLSQELGRLVFLGNLDDSEALKGRIRPALLDHNSIARDALVELVVDHQVRAKVLHPVILAVDDLAAHSNLHSLGIALGNNQSFSEA